MLPESTFLANQLLIAVPSLADPTFSRTVALICRHDADGAMGLVLNRPSEYTLGDVLDQMGIADGDLRLRSERVLAGGPVHGERGFVLHDGDQAWDSSIRLGGDLSLTTSRDVLQAMANGHGPQHALVALGCAGWGAGQLEQEIVDSSWMTAPADTGLLFDQPLDERWLAAAGKVGVNLMQMTHYSGRA